MAQRIYGVMATHVMEPIQATFNYAADVFVTKNAIAENEKNKKALEEQRQFEREMRKKADEAEAIAILKAAEAEAEKGKLEKERARVKAEADKLKKERERLAKINSSIKEKTQSSKTSGQLKLNQIEERIVNALSDTLLRYNLDQFPKSLNEGKYKEMVSIVIDSINNEFSKLHGHPMFKETYEMHQRNENENIVLIYYTAETSAKPQVVESLTTTIRLIKEGLSHAPKVPTSIRFLPSRA